jgi:hypothetical protein
MHESKKLSILIGSCCTPICALRVTVFTWIGLIAVDYDSSCSGCKGKNELTGAHVLMYRGDDDKQIQTNTQ